MSRQQVGKRIMMLRESKDWSQAELARRAGLTDKTLGAVEKGLTNSGIDVYAAIAKALGVEIGEIFSEDFAISV
jgi:transcriptional regulator with XRE-family HTH domain